MNSGQAVTPLKQLRTLGLTRTGVTDAGLKHLAALPNLQTLGLNYFYCARLFPLVVRPPTGARPRRRKRTRCLIPVIDPCFLRASQHLAYFSSHFQQVRFPPTQYLTE